MYMDDVFSSWNCTFLVVYVFIVYFPCDTNNNVYLVNENNVLSDNRCYMTRRKIDYFTCYTTGSPYI